MTGRRVPWGPETAPRAPTGGDVAPPLLGSAGAPDHWEDMVLAGLGIRQRSVLPSWMAEAAEVANPDLAARWGVTSTVARRQLNDMCSPGQPQGGPVVRPRADRQGLAVVDDELTAGAPRAGSAGGALYAVLAGMARYLRHTGLGLGEVRPRPPPRCGRRRRAAGRRPGRRRAGRRRGLGPRGVPGGRRAPRLGEPHRPALPARRPAAPRGRRRPGRLAQAGRRLAGEPATARRSPTTTTPPPSRSGARSGTCSRSRGP